MLTDEEVSKISHLSRLQLDAKEIQEFKNKLSTIFSMVEELRQVDTTSVEPMTHPLELFQRLREDQVTEMNQRELYQSVSPKKTIAGLYLVPKVIE